jgi:hypothetical protein
MGAKYQATYALVGYGMTVEIRFRDGRVAKCPARFKQVLGWPMTRVINYCRGQGLRLRHLEGVALHKPQFRKAREYTPGRAIPSFAG